MDSVPRKAACCDSGDRTGDRSPWLQSEYKDHRAKSREGTERRQSVKVQGKARGGVSDSLRQKRSGKEERMREEVEGQRVPERPSGPHRGRASVAMQGGESQGCPPIAFSVINQALCT